MVTILYVATVGMSCWRILILQQSEEILSISAAFVRTTMTYHSPGAMVATGPLDDPHQAPQRPGAKFNLNSAFDLEADRLSLVMFFVGRSFPSDTSREMPYRPVPEQNLVE